MSIFSFLPCTTIPYQRALAPVLVLSLEERKWKSVPEPVEGERIRGEGENSKKRSVIKRVSRA